MTLQEFNLTRSKFVGGAGTRQLGKNPNALLPFTNAVEIIFQVDPQAAAKKKIKNFRCRQQVASEEAWQMRLDVDPGRWVQITIGGIQPDDPDPLNQAIQPPVVAFFDSPGLIGTATTTQFKTVRGVQSDPNAVRLMLRQNFTAWVEGEVPAGGGKTQWQQVSDVVDWHSNQGLTRSLLGTPTWNSDPNTDIGLGHTSGQPTQ